MSIFDLSSLTPRDRGRVLAQLDRLYRIDGEVRTLRDHLEHYAEGMTKKIGNFKHQWNRRRFNSMTGPEQIAYEKRLARPNPMVKFANGWMIDIPKIVYAVLAVPERT